MDLACSPFTLLHVMHIMSVTRRDSYDRVVVPTLPHMMYYWVSSWITDLIDRDRKKIKGRP